MRSDYVLVPSIPSTSGDISLASLSSRSKIAVVGIHGWVPIEYIQRYISGPLVGTSEKLCHQMSQTLQSKFNIPAENITLIPLSSAVATMVDERVEMYFQKLGEIYGFGTDTSANAAMEKERSSDSLKLSNFDLLFIVTHSQGCVVGTKLISRLIKAGHLDSPKQKIIMAALGGIHHGPFHEMKDSILVKYFERPATRELFEMGNADSALSKSYREAVSHLLESSVRIVCIGGWYDPVLPLSSALFSGCCHPNLVRFVCVNEEIKNEEAHFIVEIAALNCKIMNAVGKVPQHVVNNAHALIAGIDECVTGSWSDGGHSDVYACGQCFEAAVYVMDLPTCVGSAPIWQAILENRRMHSSEFAWRLASLLKDVAAWGREARARLDSEQQQSYVNKLFKVAFSWLPLFVARGDEKTDVRVYYAVSHNETESLEHHLQRSFISWTETLDAALSKKRRIRKSLTDFRATFSAIFTSDTSDRSSSIAKM